MLRKKLIFPGVGAFGSCMMSLESLGYIEALKDYIKSDRHFMGICVGMQCLFNSSEESPGIDGLGIIDASVLKFSSRSKSVPHMGWNGANIQKRLELSNEWDGQLINHQGSKDRYYFVHSFAVKANSNESNLAEWIYSLTRYGDEVFVSSVQKGNIFATQFHPEKSGQAGLKVLEAFLKRDASLSIQPPLKPLLDMQSAVLPEDLLSRRIIACLDVRANDQGDLVVTKGDQYDVREATADGSQVRNLGKPVDLARRYFLEGADEVTFLNITSFRECPLKDAPMLQVLRNASESVFVPLTIGGGIRDVVEPDGTRISALDVAGVYFRSGADKVSIGSDAVIAAEEFWQKGGIADGTTAIQQIAKRYGAQAVVVSVDPRRVYVASPDDPAAAGHHVIQCDVEGPNGEKWCWYQCTIKGGREGRDLDVKQLVTASQELGAGEILLNCMDRDGTNSGFEECLVRDVKKWIRIPVIASSGAGNAQHFSSVFENTGVDAALAAGIFHRQEVPISQVKAHLEENGIITRQV